MIPPNLPMILEALKARGQGDPFPIPMGHGGAMGGGPPPNGPAGPMFGGAATDSSDAAPSQSRDKARAFLQQMIDAGSKAASAEPDPEDRAVIAKCLAALHGLQAKEQKENDAASGVSPAVKVVRRQSSGY